MRTGFLGMFRKNANTSALESADKAKAISAALISELVPAVESTYKDIFRTHEHLLTEDSILLLQTEELIFCLHCLARIATVELGAKADPFLSALVAEVWDLYYPRVQRWIDNSEFANGWNNILQRRENEYAKYHILKPHGHLKDNLFWEYGKRVIFSMKDHNPIRIVLVADHAMDLFQLMAETFNLVVMNRPVQAAKA
jgi:hypothetical protein